MAYRMTVLNTPWWRRFSTHVTAVYQNDCYRNKTIDYAVNDELGKYGAINIIGTPYIEFSNEEDATMFKLRWSA